MKNSLPSMTGVTTSPSAEILKATSLVAEALKNGRVKYNPDGSFNVAGAPLALVSPAGGGAGTPEKHLVNKFLFDGNTWTLQFAGTVVYESDWLGMHYTEQMIRRMYQEIHCSDLVTGAYGEAVDIMEAKDLIESGVAVSGDDEDEVIDDVDPQVVTAEFRDEILPDEDRAIVLGLLDKSKVELATLKVNGLVALIPDKEWEIEKIEKYLAKTRFGCKNSCFDGRTDKDRKSVWKAIREAIKKIAKKHPALADHLRKSIKTGVNCSYQPEAEIHWQVANKWRPVAPTE